jgi:hypothetical protein
MFSRLATLVHSLLVLVETFCTASDRAPTLSASSVAFSSRAARLERTFSAYICPIAPQVLPFFLGRVMVL